MSDRKTLQILAGRYHSDPALIQLTGWKHTTAGGVHSEAEMITGFTFTPDPHPGEASVVESFAALTMESAELLLETLIRAGVRVPPGVK